MLKTSYPNEFLILGGKQETSDQHYNSFRLGTDSDNHSKDTANLVPMTITSNKEMANKIYVNAKQRKIFSGFCQHYLSPRRLQFEILKTDS
ncbi:hypothetical protein I79_006688 [Cricetulus griseus]|uniref:Uncharacterized protein n=1 Tax=Cricetulus griseus TaxID=10029 RepID=G3H8I6_CRIGR|nr:hypothetical protein I79_006688 [Cricetulus griseus]